QFAGELNLITLEPTLLSARVAQAGEAIFVSREALRGVISRDTRLGDLITNALVSRRAITIEAESGARLIGHGGDPGTRELREFLTRNRVPHRFIDLDGSDLTAPTPDGRPLAEDDLPMLTTGNKVLRAPTILEAATALNLRAPNKTAKKSWDTLIVGGGPGGLGAGRAGDRPGAAVRPAHRGPRARPQPAPRRRPLRRRPRQRRRTGGA